MNTRGHPATLVAAQPGNANALKNGVHSPRRIEARAAEIVAELSDSFAFSPVEWLAVQEAARCMAILEAIDRDLDERGLEDKAGKPRYLLNHRWRVSQRLDHWLTKISPAIQRQTAAGQKPPKAELGDYERELQRIALGHDPSASPRDRISAIKTLFSLPASSRAQQVVKLEICYPEERPAPSADAQEQDGEEPDPAPAPAVAPSPLAASAPVAAPLVAPLAAPVAAPAPATEAS